MKTFESAESAWRRRAGITARKINAAWWLERFAPLAMGTSIAAFCVILLLRSKGIEPAAGPLAGALAGAFLLAALLAFLSARRSFCSIDDALVRLEARLGLHNALTSAANGVRPWPAAPGERPEDGIRWRWPWLTIPLATAAAAVAAAILVPVSTESDAVADTVREPSAWQQIESMLEVLDEEEIVREESLRDFQERVEELRAQPKEEWYSHRSMEASDHERARLENAISEMAANLDKATRTLTALEKFDEQITGQARERLLAEFDQGLKGLDASELGLDPELMKALSEIDPSKLRAIDPETLKKLMERLKNATLACSECQGGSGEGAAGWGDLTDAELLALINGTGEGKDAAIAIGSIPGRGGITRGPGSAPISLAEEESDLGTQNPEAIRSQDPSQGLPSDLVGISQGEHELDRTDTATTSGGAVSDTGRGGETVWRESLLPSEKKILERYFD